MSSNRTLLGLLCLTIVFSASAPAAEEEKPAAKAAAPKADPFVVPDGTPDELLAFIEDVQGRQPEGGDAEAAAVFQKKLHRAVLKAADKILAGQPTDPQTEAAVRWKVISLSSLDQLGDAGAGKQLAALPAELLKAGKKTLGRRVRAVLLDQRLRQAMMGGAEDLDKLIGDIKRHLADGPLGQMDAGLAMTATRVLEITGKEQLAADTYRSLGKLLTASNDPEISKLGTKMEGAARRVTLVGKPMPLRGTFVDGKPLDWAKYKGKVVLVQFWATWCGPCRQEIPNIRKNYDLYHTRGFDVLAISCDDDRQRLEDFLKENRIPWQCLFSEDPAATGMDHPMATHYGVMGIPTLILVGRDGKVISLEARGPQLGQELEKLFRS